MRRAYTAVAVASAIGFHGSIAAASAARATRVCVEIDVESWTREGTRPAPKDTAQKPPEDEAPPSTDPVEEEEPPRDEPAPPDPDPESEPADPANGNETAPSPPTGALAPEIVPVRGDDFASFGVSDASEGESVPASDAEAASDEPAASPDTVASKDADPFAIDPERYLKRLIEHQVTHEVGFESVDEGCDETLTVELYPIEDGWTVFARYSGHAREEKVDRVELDEFDALSARLSKALLRDKSVSETLTRTTVLRADSEPRVRQIRGRPHFLFALGSAVRAGELPTAPNVSDPAEDEFRIETPLSFAIGARSKFRAWALDGYGRLNIGTSETASRRNRGGGHVDYSVGLGVGLHFIGFLNPEGVNSVYLGGGGSFDLSRYQVIAATSENGAQRDPDGLWGGGLNIDALVGYEFMRASALHFFVELDVSAPAYVFESESDEGRIGSYIPSAIGQVGLLF